MAKLVHLIAVAGTLAVASSAHAQYHPLGTHDAPMGAGSGRGSGQPSASGRYTTAVPLALPSPRGDLSVPLTVVYTGGRRYGAAGSGWDIPLSYVRRSRTVGRRKPSPANPRVAQERISLSLGGGEMLMVPGDEPRRYTPFAGMTPIDLQGPFAGGTAAHELSYWLAYDPSGRMYQFMEVPTLGDGDIWYLAEIYDSTRNNRVTLHYQVDVVNDVAELSLSEVAYAYSADLDCPQYRATMDYAPPDPANPELLSQLGGDGILVGRRNLLQRIQVLSYVAGSCALGHEPIATYTFEYARARGRGSWQLAAVDRHGVGAVDPSRPGLPVARYEYGSAITGTDSDELDYQPVGTVTMPPGVAGAFSATHESSGTYSFYRTDEMLVDWTGDGLPDFVSDGKISVNHTGPSGTTFAAPVDLFAADEDWVELSETRADRDFRFGEHQNVGSSVWTRTTDFNGDGRLDIVEAGGNAWRVHLNVPDPSDPRGFHWELRAVDVSQIRKRLEDVYGSLSLPLSRSESVGSGVQYMCLEQVSVAPTTPYGSYDVSYRACSCDGFSDFGDMCPEGGEGKEAWNGKDRPGASIALWNLVDVNGDGRLDFVFNTAKTTVVQSGPTSPALSDCRTCSAEDQSGCRFQSYGGGPDAGVSFERATCMVETTFDLPTTNTIQVFYNVGHMGLEFASEPVALVDDAPCGVERWVSGNPLDHREWRSEVCGLADLNSDGLADYLDRPAPREPAARLRLNRGLAGGGLVASAVTTGVLARSENNYFTECIPEGEPPAPDDHVYYDRELVRLADVNGDGVIDRVHPYSVELGNGAGFEAPVAYATSAGYQEMSVTARTCGGTVARTVEGMVDINGDGRPDRLVQIGGEDSSTTPTFEIWSVVGASDEPGALDDGLLIREGNGYGAWREIHYTSAKEQLEPPSSVPYSEIVVAQIAEVSDNDPARSRAPVRYAYDGLELRYDSLAATWIPTGYARRVALMGIDDPHGLTVDGTAVITDALTPLDVPLGYAQYAYVGLPRSTHRLDGHLVPDPWALLALDLEGAPPATLHAGQRVDYQQRSQATSPDPNPIAHECYGVLPYSETADPTQMQLCRTSAIVFAREMTSWEGDAPPPSSSAVEVRTLVSSVDDKARPLLVHNYNDVHRSDDDTCVETTYASSGVYEPGVLDAPATTRVTNCLRGSQRRVLAGVRYVYDDLPEGNVRDGLMTQQITERYDLESGAEIEEIPGGELAYDDYGNVETIVSRRAADAEPVIAKYLYDARRLLPTTTLQSADGVSLTRSIEYDPLLRIPTSTIDENDVEVRTSYDDYGRPRASSVVVDKVEYRVSDTRYYGDLPLAGQMRRVRTTTYPAWTPVAADTSSAESSTSTAFLDDFGALHHVEHPLGVDYDNAVMISGQTLFDERGRPRFTADPYPATAGFGGLLSDATLEVGLGFPSGLAVPPALLADKYGTTLHYDLRGRVDCAMSGTGPQPGGSGCFSKPAEDVYATRYEVLYKDHERIARAYDANARTTGSAHFGEYSQQRQSAIGWTLATSRHRGGGTAADRVDFSYYPVGFQRQIRRARKPDAASSPVVTTETLRDSLGQVLELREPGVARRHNLYDWSGALTATYYTDTTGSKPIEKRVSNRYDARGRLVEVSRLENGAAIGKPDLYFYDQTSGDPAHGTPRYLRGRLSHTFDGVMETFYSYDALGRVERTTRVAHADGRPFTQTARYGLGGRLEGIAFQVPGTAGVEGVSYAHDSAGLVREVEWHGAGGKPATMFHANDVDVYGRYRQVTLGNGVVEEYAYRDGGRRELLSRAVRHAEGVNITAYTGYDGTGRVTGREDLMRKGTSGPWRVDLTRYEHDELYRLTRARTDRTSGPWPGTLRDERFYYDTLGNVLGRLDGASGGDKLYVTPDYAEDPDRVYRVARVPGPGKRTHRYDGAGNATSINGEPSGGETLQLRYDAASQLIGIAGAGAKAELARDASGAVASVSIRDMDGIVRRDRRYGGLLQESQFMDAAEPVVERVIPGPMGPLAARRTTPYDAVVQYIHGEPTGNRLFTDDTGQVKQQVDYFAFGETYRDTGIPGSIGSSTYLFNGGDTLDPFGLIHLGARFYDPRLGRFLQRDPLIVPRGTSAMNPYAFALNDPINFTDPSGLDGEAIGKERGGGGAWWEGAGWGAGASGLWWMFNRYVVGGGADPYRSRRLRLRNLKFLQDNTNWWQGGLTLRERMFVGGVGVFAGGYDTISFGAFSWAMNRRSDIIGAGIQDLFHNGTRGNYYRGGYFAGASAATVMSFYSGIGALKGAFQGAGGWLHLGTNVAAADAAGGSVLVGDLISGGSRWLLGANGIHQMSSSSDSGPSSTTSGGSAARGAVSPSTIRFSQSSIGRTFSSGGTLRETIEGLRSGAISPEAFPPIRVLECNGLTFTLDNRRLFVFQEAGVPIRTVPATAEEIAAEAWKFTTRNEGASIRVRGGL